MVDDQSEISGITLVEGEPVGRRAAGEVLSGQSLASEVGGAVGGLAAAQLEGSVLESTIRLGLGDGEVSDLDILGDGEGGGAKEGNGGGNGELHFELGFGGGEESLEL